EEEVLRKLLRDGRAARDDAPALAILLARLLDRLPVETLMIHEPGVFGDDDRALQVLRDARIRNPGMLEARRRVAAADLLEAGLHEGGDLRVMVPPPPDADEE